MVAQVDFLDDATWNAEREAIEVTAVVPEAARPRHVRCVIAAEALNALTRAPAALPPLRLFRDFEPTLAKAAARRYDPRAGEIVLGRRDIGT